MFQNITVNITQESITTINADVVVNAANPRLLGGGGVDGAIHRSAGPQLLEECRTLGGCEVGNYKATAAYNLPAKQIFHAVGPIYDYPYEDITTSELLEAVYLNCLFGAMLSGHQHIVFPNISTGIYGFPKDKAVDIVYGVLKKLDETSSIWEEFDAPLIITFTCFDDENYQLYCSKFND